MNFNEIARKVASQWLTRSDRLKGEKPSTGYTPQEAWEIYLGYLRDGNTSGTLSFHDELIRMGADPHMVETALATSGRSAPPKVQMSRRASGDLDYSEALDYLLNAWEHDPQGAVRELTSMGFPSQAAREVAQAWKNTPARVRMGVRSSQDAAEQILTQAVKKYDIPAYRSRTSNRQAKFPKGVEMTVDEVAEVVGPEFKEMNENPPPEVVEVREKMEKSIKEAAIRNVLASRDFDAIGPGDTVEFLDQRGDRPVKVMGKVVMRSRGMGGWVVNLGGRHGTPGLVSPRNFIRIVKHG